MADFDEVITLALNISGAGDVTALTAALKAVGDSGAAAAPQAKALADQLEKLSQQNDLISQFVADKAALAALGDQMNTVGARLNDFKARLAATTTPSVALQKSVASTEASLESLSLQFGAQQAALTKTGNALEAAGVNTKNLDAAQREVQSSIGDVAAAATTLGTNMGTVAVATEEAGEKAAQTGTLFGALRDHLGEIVTIAAAVEIALKGIEFGSESLKGAEQVEASLSRVKALAGDAAQSFGDLDEAVEQAAKAVNVTTQQSAAGLTALVAQGLTANQAIAALIPTLQVAKIANEDVATAASQVAEALKAYNVPAEQAAEIVDKLTAASKGAAGGLGEISSAAGKLAPDAQAIGLSFDQVVAALGLLASKGQDSAKTVEGLRTVFQQLQDPTSNLRVALLALGDGTSDFGTAVGALTAKTPQAQQALLLLDGNARTLVQTLGNAGPGAIEAFNQGLQSTQGIASKTAAALDNNLTGASTRFLNSIDAIGEKLVQPILAPFTTELTKLAGELDAFAASPDFAGIRESVAQMAQSAATSLDQFLHSVNWSEFASDAQANIKRISDDLKSLGESAKTVASAVNKAGDAIGGAYHGVASVIDLAESAGAKIASLGLDVVKAGADITVGTDEASKGLDGMRKSVDDFADSKFDAATEHSTALANDFLDVATTAPAAAAGIDQTGAAALTAAPAMQQHADAATEAATASTALGISLVGVPGYLQDIADAAGETVPKLSEIGQAASTIPESVDEARAALINAVDAFKQLQASGNATPAALTAAGNAVSGLSLRLVELQQKAAAADGALASAFVGLGVTSQAALQQAANKAKTFFDQINAGAADTAAGLADRQNAFLAYAKAALAASADLDQGTQDATQSNLEAEAATLGLTDKLQTLENQANKTDTALSKIGSHGGSNGASGAFDDVSSSADKAGKAVGDVANETDEANDALSSFGTEGLDSMNQLTSALANTRQGFLNISQAAAQAFDTHLLADFFTAFDSTGIGFQKVIDGMNEASAEVTTQINNQRTVLQNEIDGINQLGIASTTNFGAFGTNAAAASAKMESLSNLIAQGKFNAGLLGQSDLQPLQQALDAAAQRAQQLADNMKEANDTFAQTVADLQDAFDEEEGNQQAIEDRRHQTALANLQAEAKAAGQLNSQTYQQAVAQENALHALKEKNLPADSGSGSSGGSGSGSSTTSSSDTSSTAGGLAPRSSSAQTFNIHLNGPVIGTDAKSLANYLGKAMASELKNIQANSRVNILTGRAA